MNHSHWRLAALLPLALVMPFGAGHDAAAFAQSVDDQAVLRDYLSGNGLLNRGMFDLAAKEYRKFLEAHPDHEKAPVARYGLSVALVRLGSHEEAERELAGLPQMDDFEFGAEVGLLLGQCRLALGRHADAAAALHVVVSEYPEHEQADDALALLAEAQHRAGDHEAVLESAALMASRWKAAPLRERAEFFAGLSEIALKKPAEAASRFDALLRAFPKGALAPRAALLLARCQEQNEDLEAASAQYQRVIEAGDASFVPEAMYSLASILRRQEHPEDAARLLDRLLKDYPQSGVFASALIERGRTHFDLGEFDDATDLFEQAVEADDRLADVAAYWLAKCELRGGDFEGASRRLADAIAEHPKSDLLPEMRYDRAIALLRGGDTAEAVDALSEFRTHHANHDLAPDALHLLAAAEHQRADYDRSSACCDEFLRQYPKHPLASAAAFLAAENLYLKGDLRGAAARFEAFLGDYPDDPQTDEARYRLGSALFRLDDPEQATKHLEAVVNGPQTPERFRSALLDLGDIHFAGAQWAAAADRFDQYLRASGDTAPDADDALLKLGLSLHRQDLFDEALRAYDRVIAGHPKSVHATQARFERGQALVALERFSDAAAALRSLLDDPAAARFMPHVLAHLGAIAMREKAYVDAAGYYARLGADAESSADMRAEALFQQGQALMALDRFADAAAVFASLAKDSPRHDRAAAARANEALCLARQGKHEEALAAISRLERDSIDRLDSTLASTLLYEKAWSRRETGDDAGAIEVYRAMLDDGRDTELDLFARVELAELEGAAGRHAESADLLRDLVERDTLPGDLHERSGYRFAAGLYELKRDEEAAAAFEKFLSAHPDSNLAMSAHLLAGEALFRLQRLPAAAGHFDEVVASAVDDRLLAPALLRLGEARAAVQDWPRSKAAFETYLEKFGDSELWFQARFGVGFALENQQKYDEAIAAYGEVVEKHQGPTAARSQFQIGECLFAQKKHDEAVRELLKVDILYAYPEWSAAALYEAGRCFEALNQTGQAKQHFQMVRDRHADTRWAQLAAQRLEALAQTDLPGRGGGT